MCFRIGKKEIYKNQQKTIKQINKTKQKPQSRKKNPTKLMQDETQINKKNNSSSNSNQLSCFGWSACLLPYNATLVLGWHFYYHLVWSKMYHLLRRMWAATSGKSAFLKKFKKTTPPPPPPSYLCINHRNSHFPFQLDACACSTARSVWPNLTAWCMKTGIVSHRPFSH